MATYGNQKNFGTITGAATTEIVPASGTATEYIKVRELRIWVNGPGTWRLTDGTAAIIQGLTGAGIGAPDGGDMEISISSRSGSTYIAATQGVSPARALSLITTGATATFGGSIVYDYTA